MTRLPTGVPGLDTILHGGLFAGGVYILEGSPGVGKTTLANQIAYLQARQQAKTLYLTMLAESHARMLQHMEGQTFFRREAVNSEVFYVSGYRELEKEGLRGVVGLLHSEVRRTNATFLVVDGLVVEAGLPGVDDSARQFVHELQSLAGALGCTCLLLTSGRGSTLSAEQTMVDGIFAFEDHSFHWRAERRLQVRKFRGSAVARGQHTFCITPDGLAVFPRLEELDPGPVLHSLVGTAVVATGLRALDAALSNGGLMSGTASVLIGDSGAGKTSAGLAFAMVATPAAPCLFLSGCESEGDLKLLGDDVMLDVSATLSSGAVRFEAVGRRDESLDEMGHRILRLVDELRVKRLVVDGLAALADTLAFPERGYRFLGRLLLELKHRGVTSLFTVDPDALAAASQTPLAQGVVGWFDNAFHVRASAENAERHLEIRKVRGSRASRSSVDVRVPMN